MQQRALVLLNAWNSGPLPVIQNTGRIDENVAVIRNRSVTCEVLDMHIVPALLFIPVRARHLVLRLDILVQSILPRKVVEVGKNLL